MAEATTRFHPGEDFGSGRRAALVGARRALGTPSVVLGASFIGFGALVQQVGLDLWHALFSTATGWALPGQVALVELYALGTPLLAIALAVGLTNARLLPMAITLLPIVRAPGIHRVFYYLAAHLIAVTGWIAAMRDCPRLPVAQRLPYFVGFAGALWCVTLVTTALGFALAGAVPREVTLGLVFINPIYFMLLLFADLRGRSRILAAVLGAILGPLSYLIVPDWSLLLTGVAAGSLAFTVGRVGRRRIRGRHG